MEFTMKKHTMYFWLGIGLGFFACVAYINIIFYFFSGV